MDYTVQKGTAAGKVAAAVGAGSVADNDAGDTQTAGDTPFGEIEPEEPYTIVQLPYAAQPEVCPPGQGYSAGTDRSSGMGSGLGHTRPRTRALV